MGKPVTKPVEVDLSKELPQKEEVKKQSKKAVKKGVQKVRGQKYQEAVEQVERGKEYPLNEAIELAQRTSYTKFPGTLELHINTSAKNLRGLVSLPYVSGKSLKVLAFGKGAAEAQADIVGSDETIAEIEKGPSTSLRVNSKDEVKLSDIDVIVVTPEWMPKLARVAKVLGPKGLMPNPKSGTITDNLAKAVADLKGGKTEYRTEANGQAIHLGVGKVSQPTQEIAANIKALYMVVGKSKVKKAVLSPTMGPGVKIQLSSI